MDVSVRRRKALGGAGSGAGTVLLAAVLVMANYLASRHYLRGDWTKGRVFSLSEKSRAIAHDLKRDVEVLVVLPRSLDVFGHVEELLQRLGRESKRLSITFVDPEEQVPRAESLAREFSVAKYDLQEGVVIFVAGQGAERRHKVVTQSELVDVDLREGAGGPDAHVRGFKGEGAFASALLAVSETAQLEVCIAQDHGEAAMDSLELEGMSSLVDALKADNYAVRKVEHLSQGLPKTCRVLLVAGPQRAFPKADVEALEGWLDAGGRALFLLGPELDRGLTAWQKSGLEPALLRRGVRLGDSVVFDPAHTHPTEGPQTFAIKAYGAHPMVRAMKDRLTFWPAARDVHPAPRQGIDASDLASTGEDGFGETSLAALRREAEIGFDKATDIKGPVPVAVAAEGKAQKWRIVVLGSFLFGANLRLQAPVDYNRDFLLGAVAWLGDRPALVAIGAKAPEHVRLVLDEAQRSKVFWVSIAGVPLACAFLGLYVWRRRRA